MYYLKTRSEITNTPIIVVFTKDSKNEKTGDMVQTWILLDYVTPVQVSRGALDGAICGDCTHRHSLGGACYVAIGRAPQSVFNAYRRGSYEELDYGNPAHVKALQGRPVRLGAYGDPAAVPIDLWDRYFEVMRPSFWTGYSHSWRLKGAQSHRKYCCASVDSPAEYATARAAGWKPFRTRRPGEELLEGEFVCPASEEAGYRLTCATCKACNGNPHERARAGSAAIFMHGFKVRKG